MAHLCLIGGLLTLKILRLLVQPQGEAYQALTKYPDRYIQRPLSAFWGEILQLIRGIYNVVFLLFLHPSLWTRSKSAVNPCYLCPKNSPYLRYNKKGARGQLRRAPVVLIVAFTVPIPYVPVGFAVTYRFFFVFALFFTSLYFFSDSCQSFPIARIDEYRSYKFRISL